MDVLGTKWTCRAAAENGHLECLKYLHDKGCPESENYELCKYEDLECKYKKLEEENEKLKEKIERLETKVRHLS
jgi:predicted nuclease with TOPRIM domain